MDDGRPFLERIPREIRDKIYRLALLDPARPILEGKNKSIKYENYLGVLFVNKQVYMEVKVVLEEIKPIFIISCNILNLGEEMIRHGIPYLSDHHVGRVRYSSLRLHVKFPTCREHSKELRAYVVLCEHLAEICLLLRGLSLTPPDSDNQIASFEETLVHKMKIAIRLGSHRGASMLESVQFKILEHMTCLKYAGIITVSGSVTDAGRNNNYSSICRADKCIVKGILQGHDSLAHVKSMELNGDIEEMVFLLMLANSADNKDSVKIASWKNAIAERAYDAKDFQLALDRYLETMEFTRKYLHSSSRNIMGSEESAHELNLCIWNAQFGHIECILGLGPAEQAAYLYKVLTRFFTFGNYNLPQSIAGRGMALEERLREELGAEFDNIEVDDVTIANEIANAY